MDILILFNGTCEKWLKETKFYIACGKVPNFKPCTPRTLNIQTAKFNSANNYHMTAFIDAIYI